jgi:hypothetical protein
MAELAPVLDVRRPVEQALGAHRAGPEADPPVVQDLHRDPEGRRRRERFGGTRTS